MRKPKPEYQLCPICNGNGTVDGGFYLRAGNYPYSVSDHTMETCRACNGKGMIERPNPAEVGADAMLSVLRKQGTPVEVKLNGFFFDQSADKVEGDAKFWEGVHFKYAGKKGVLVFLPNDEAAK